jgi:hypothetical protein
MNMNDLSLLVIHCYLKAAFFLEACPAIFDRGEDLYLTILLVQISQIQEFKLSTNSSNQSQLLPGMCQPKITD